MEDKPQTPAARQPEERREKASRPRNDEERRVWDALEDARQTVKPLTKRELEAEVLSDDLLNIRLKSTR